MIIKISRWLKTREPSRLLFAGYFTYCVIGALFLCIPIFSLTNISFLDNLFTAVSAVSTTGLCTVTISENYNFFGNLIILLLIQLGGLGYMTFGSFIILSSKREISIERQNILETSFSLPKDFKLTKFIRSIVIYTLIIEFIGAIFLVFIFWQDKRINPFWSAIFHSVSSFCTAGFSLYKNSFENYSVNIALNIVISILSILGAIGYIVMVDVWLLIRKKKEKITFTSKVILTLTIWLLILGTLFFFLNEHNMQEGPGFKELLHSFFQCMTALTTVGFNTIPISQIKQTSLLLLTILMVIGSSPSGTGGGIKSTTVSSLWALLKSVLNKHKEFISYTREEKYETADKNSKPKRNIFDFAKQIFKLKKFISKKKENNLENQKELRLILGDIFKIKLMNKIIPYERIVYAICTFVFYILILVIGFYILLFTEKMDFQKLLFEAASALGTVGLSTGITNILSEAGKITIIILMFIGRIGPITFGMALFYRSNRREKDSIEDIVI
ncbi:MAG: hypothetical protein JXB88_09110 [Spirochaetales bacterium]|nr:hypothetical protein [Spirochaetales bacterium]